MRRYKDIFFVLLEVESLLGGGDYSILRLFGEVSKYSKVVILTNRNLRSFDLPGNALIIRVPQLSWKVRGSTRVNKFIYSIAVIFTGVFIRLYRLRWRFFFVGYLRRSAIRAVFWSRLFKVRSIVMHFETPNWIEHVVGVRSSAKREWERVKKAYQQTSYLFSNSEMAKSYCQKWIGRKPDGVIYPGIEKADYAVASNAREDIVLVLGRVVSMKSPESAVRIVAQCMTAPRLVFVGCGDRIRETRRLAQNLGVQASFLGLLPDMGKWQLLSRVKVVFSPSLFEGFGMSPGEALVVGTPCVARDLPIYREVYSDAVEYFETEVSAARKIDKLITDEEYWQQRSEAGMKFISGRYTWEKAARVVLSEVQRLR